MRAGTVEIAEFYSQLALLTRSGMPLPGSLQQLARNATDPGFQKALAEVQDRAAHGEKLADTLRHYPQYFDRVQVGILAAGEASGTLPETLHSVARYVHFCHVAGGRVQEILTYPMMTMHLSVILFLCISVFVVPEFRSTVVELLDGGMEAKLPLIARAVFAFSAFAEAHRVLVLLFYVASLAATVWLLSGSRSTQRAFNFILACIPGGRRLHSAMDSTRVATLWSLLVRHRTPLPDILVTSAAMVERAPLAAALLRAADRIRTGVPATAALDQEPAVDPLLAMTLQYTPEDRLPDELGRLAGVLEQRVSQTTRAVITALVVISCAVAALFCGVLVIAMFSPLIVFARGMCNSCLPF